MVQGGIVLEFTGNVWLSQEKSSMQFMSACDMDEAGGQTEKQNCNGKNEQSRI